MSYSKKHKVLLQAIIQEGALSEYEGKKLVLELFGHDHIAKVLNDINIKLQLLNMTIKCVNCEVTGNLYWILASTVQEKSANFPLEFSQAQLELLRNIYSEIITSNTGKVSSTWCLNLCSTLNHRLTKTEAEEFLQLLVNRKWLFYKNGKYYIGVRSIAELQQYFKDTYDDNFTTCILCKQSLYYGAKCDSCDTTTHVYCLKAYMRNSKLGCPNCHSAMPGITYSDDTNSLQN
ncbi:non-structural maintenance of chromosomes element 1 homolog [Pseudomyrmex gracilis]|uniref:non-structural maintenance of chromosomes element 1 homolog n=1 Tax=Pseudomyrmex gracilis TaxID=219809 RepID=UPI000994E9F6|nr:non-structural maintenance of chromosomes element 1 homolog [Pseudomyrmex gracilis]